MTTEFLIRVKVDPGDAVGTANAVGAALDGAKSKADDLAGTLKSAFGLYFVEQAVEEIGKMADGYTALQNRLRTVATDQANLNGLTEATYKIAQETRTSWEDVAGMYSRVARNAGNLGYSQKDLITFQRALNQEVKIGGATAMEASAGLVQLSQGLASGTLRGDELRSVLEQLPTVADTIAKHMGTTRGGIRELGKQGKISGKEVVDAFLEASDSINAEFGKTVPTLADDMVMLKNAFQNFLGTSDAAKSVMGGLGAAVVFVIAHMDTLAKILMTVATIIMVYVVQQAIAGVIKALGALAVAAAANPFAAFLWVVVALVAAIRQFGDDIDIFTPKWYEIGKSTITLGDALRAIWQIFKELGAAIGEFLADSWKKLQDAFGTDGIDHDKVETGLMQVVQIFMRFIFTVYEMFHHFKDVITVLLVGIPVEMANAFAASYPNIAAGLIKIVNLVIRAVDGIKNLGNLPRVKEINDELNARRERVQDTGVVLRKMNDESVAHPNAPGTGPGAKQPVIDNMLADQAEIKKLEAELDAITHGGADHQIDAKAFLSDLSGAAHTARELRSNTVKAWFGDVDDDMKHFMDVLKKIAGEREKEESKVNKDKGPAAAIPDDGKEKAKLQKELDAVREESNPITAAIVKIEKAMDVLDRALARNMIKLPEYMRLYGDLMTKYRDVIHPYEAYIGKLQEEEDALIELRDRHKALSDVDKEMIAVRKQQHEAGVDLNADQEAEIRMYLESIEMKKHEIEVIKELEAENKKSATAMVKYAEDYKKWEDRTGVGVDAVREGLVKVRNEAYNVGKDMREIFVSFYKRVSDAIVTFVKTGEFNWKAFVTSTLEDIERILVKLATLDVINALGLGEKAPVKPKDVLGPSMVEPMTAAGTEVGTTWFEQITAAGTQVAQAMYTAITAAGSGSALPSLGALGAAGASGAGASAADDAAAQAAELAYIARFPRVPGSVKTTAANGNAGSATQRRGSTTNVRVINVQDPRAALGAVDSRDGEKVITNFMRRNAGYIRGITGTRRG